MAEESVCSLLHLSVMDGFWNVLKEAPVPKGNLQVSLVDHDSWYNLSPLGLYNLFSFFDAQNASLITRYKADIIHLIFITGITA